MIFELIKLEKNVYGYDIKQSDGEVPMRQGLWGMQSTP